MHRSTYELVSEVSALVTPSTFGGFVEQPKMAWDETICYNDYVKVQHWWFSGNFYTQKPDSQTMVVWDQRDFRAYLQAHNTPFVAFGGKTKGHFILLLRDGLIFCIFNLPRYWQ